MERLVRAVSLTQNTQRAVEAFKRSKESKDAKALESVVIEDVPADPPEGVVSNLIEDVPADPPEVSFPTFKAGDFVQSTRTIMVPMIVNGFVCVKPKRDLSKKYNAIVKASLVDVFAEADTDGDGKLTYIEWAARMDKLMPADEVTRLFDEIDADQNGVLDMHEFKTGLAGKYEIHWAQDPQHDNVRDAKDLVPAPGGVHDGMLFRYEANLDRERKNRQVAAAKAALEGNNEEEESGLSAAMIATAMTFCGLLACVIVIPLCHIILASVLYWDTSKAWDDPESECDKEFPKWMMVTGILQMVLYALLLAGFIMKGTAQARKLPKEAPLALASRFCLSTAYLALLAFWVCSILMFYALFDSERDCGARLYDYTTALVITYGFHFMFTTLSMLRVLTGQTVVR